MTPGLSHRLAAFVLPAILLVAPATLVAQTNERMYEDLDFRFVTPGARAVAMGKTFIGFADDATAAVSNPAGLSNLLEQEFSFEFTGTKIKHQRFFPSAAGELQTFGETVVTPSFFSYVIPVRRATISVFINSVQDYRESFEIGPRDIPSLGEHSQAWQVDKVSSGLGRITSANLALSTNLSPKGMKKDNESRDKIAKSNASDSDKEFLLKNPDAYIDFKIPWNLRISYNVDYSHPTNSKSTITQAARFNGDFSLSEKWKITYNSGYDFQAKEIKKFDKQKK